MTDEEKFWFVVRELGDCAKNVPLPVLRAIQLIGLKETEVIKAECEKLKQRVCELELKVELLETYTKHVNPDSGAYTLRENTRRIRREQILNTLKECSGNLDRACESLGIHRSTMYRLVPGVRKLYSTVNEWSLGNERNNCGINIT